MERRVVLMNPGPVLVHERVRRSLLRPDICHREEEFERLLRGVGDRVVQVCGGDASHTAVAFSGSGTTALEATISSVVPEQGKLLVLDNGHYGERLLKIAAAHRIATTHLAFGWATPIDPGRIDEALRADPAITHVAMVHHETSTGMLNPLREVGEIVARGGRQLIVDAVSSVGGEALGVRVDRVDWCVGTANKCIEGVPGVSFVCAPTVRIEALEGNPTRTFCLDLRQQYLAQQSASGPRFTPAVQTLYALETALDLLLTEGVSQRAGRYRALARQLRSGMTDLGFGLLLPPQQRSNTLTSFLLPASVTYRELHDGLKAEGFVIYASQEGLQRSTFRLANMGQVTSEDIDRFLGTIGRWARVGAGAHRSAAP